MSEFKFACPVCGQHIKCDSSQAGTVMDCPTCFQKINVPQAPTEAGQKFILTGTQVAERPPTTTAPTLPSTTVVKGFPSAVAFLLILLFLATAGGAIYWVKVLHPRQIAQLGSPGTKVPGAPKPKPPPKPPLVAPPANDTNWMLVLNSNAIPASPVAGRIHGQDFIVERAAFQNGTLTLRTAAHAPADLIAAINFSGAQPEDVSGKIINIGTNVEKAARVTLRWKDSDGKVQKESYDAGYALRLEFGTLERNRLPGRIYLCTPDDEKSYLAGTFNADARKPKPKTPSSPKSS